MRVSIVATALDGQQPESKSVINMVHRIQNRNHGYYDVSAFQKNNLNNSSGSFIQSTSGANALQVENEEIKSTENELLNSMVDENMAVNNLHSEEISNDTIISNETPLNLEQETKVDKDDNQITNSNGLENFELSEETPQLFNPENEILNEKIEENSETGNEEDELEIPAFLRRQKN